MDGSWLHSSLCTLGNVLASLRSLDAITFPAAALIKRELTAFSLTTTAYWTAAATLVSPQRHPGSFAERTDDFFSHTSL